jgi:hypothetical protein
MTSNPTAPATDGVAGFFGLARELRDQIYLNALSEDGQTSEFSLVEKGGEQLLVGPNVLALMLSCRQVYDEMQGTLHNDLVIHLDNADAPARPMLAKLRARGAKKLSISRFTAHSPLANTRPGAYGDQVGSSSLPSSMTLLNMRFPKLRELNLGVDVLEFIDYLGQFEEMALEYLNPRPNSSTSSVTTNMHTIFRTLRTHPNISSMHVRLVWETFLEEHGPIVGPTGIYWGYPGHIERLREQLQGMTIELVQPSLPTAIVTGCIPSKK